MPDTALDGLLVADFSRVLAGPYATMLLADLGADVVKVERPGGGDDTRAWGPPWSTGPGPAQATYFMSVNRNKRSVAWDLGQPDGLRQAQQLVRRADVLVENFKPGTFERLGLGYDDLRVDNPGLVYCSITGFGHDAGRDLPGYDLLVQAVGGLMSMTGSTPDEPVKVGVALVDVITGLHAGLGILAALRHRDRTGHGQRVEVNLLSSLLSGLVNQSSGYVAGGYVPGIMGNRHPSIAPYESYPTADKPFVVAVGNDRQFASCAAVLGLAELADDDRFRTNPDRVRHRDELYQLMSERLLTRGADEWFTDLSAAGVPCGPINDVAGAFALAERLGLAPVRDVSGVPTVANPLTMSATPARYDRPPPRLGEDTLAVAAELASASAPGGAV
ncbi:MAG: CoA transferase [Actinomycetota bacterium]|nr:CoA transferase [Actinomycetota bacterium]MDH4353675.1 CoA transferase [Actinomycetota bacterium]